MPTPFEVLGLQPAFDLDPAVLEQKLIEASLKWHPDRFALAPEADRLAAEDQMAAINEAHDLLADPLLRAEFLLTAANQDLGADGQNPNLHADRNSDPMFLMEMMELREEVDSTAAKGGEPAQELHQKLGGKELKVLQQFARCWQQAAADGQVQSALPELQKHYEHARYLRSSRRQLEQALHTS